MGRVHSGAGCGLLSSTTVGQGIQKNSKLRLGLPGHHKSILVKVGTRVYFSKKFVGLISNLSILTYGMWASICTLTLGSTNGRGRSVCQCLSIGRFT